ncbi:MAG: hypothetical protein KDK00_08755 [Rhodobacteraceae bacterium]|nr:hypothetical protein [Paracoccaceae bacterium]
MDVDRKLGIYLNDGIRGDVEAGRHNFFTILMKTFADRDFEVTLYPNTPEERLRSADRPGYSMFHLETSTHERSLDVRLAYMYPFWRIERARWREDYRLARMPFRPETIDEKAAQQFFNFWRRQTFVGKLAKDSEKGFVLVALQGRLLEQRHGQTMAPIEMVRTTIAEERFRKIRIKLHPSEIHDRAELTALTALARDSRVEIITDGNIHQLLQDCDYVVTENSSVAFKGILHRRPAICFGETDFHHLFASVAREGAPKAFKNILVPTRAYAKYFYWFLQLNCINAGRDFAPDRILEQVRVFGWKV